MRRLFYNALWVCTILLVSCQERIANAYTFPIENSHKLEVFGTSIHTMTLASAPEDTLSFERENSAESLHYDTGSAGFLFELVGGGIQTGFRETDYLFGINQRHILGHSLFGEARVLIGMISDNVQKSRFIPAEYRLNYRFYRQNRGSVGQTRLLSPYLYLGAGIIYHKPVEINPPVDPRTGLLEGRLLSSSLYNFESGITPVVPLGAGVNVSVDPSVNLNLQLGYHRVLNQLAIRGDGFRRNYFLGLTVGLNFSHDSPSTASPYPGPAIDKRRPYPDTLSEDQSETVQEASPEVEELLPQIGEIDVDERSTSPVFPAGMRVDTMKAGQCNYSVQLGSFLTMWAAFSAVDELKGKTGYSFELYFNRRNGLYMVRTRSSPSLSDAVRIARDFDRLDGFPDVAVVNQCYENPSAKPKPLTYQVQIASFQSLENAERYAEDVRKKYRVFASVQQTDDAGFFRVRTRTYSSIFEARRVLEMLEIMGLGEDLFLTSSSETTRSVMNFEYELYLGSHSSAKEAVEQAEILQSEFGFDFRVVVVEEKETELHLFLDTWDTVWKELLKFKNKIESSEFIKLPSVINLIER